MVITCIGGFNVNQMYVKNNLVKFANEGNLVKIPIKNKISVNFCLKAVLTLQF